jgi:hypothetical protein
MIEPGRYFIGGEVRITASFVDSSGDPVDPDTVTFRTCSPNNTKASYVYGTDSEVQKTSTGNYTADFTPDRAGRWHYRWQTTDAGTTTAIEGRDLIVQRSPFFDSTDTAYIIP